MACPRKLKTCTQAFYRAYDNGKHYICSGILNKKQRGGVKMDICRVCMTSHYIKKPLVIDNTPDEALVHALAFGAVADAWLENFAPFMKWRDENDR